MREIKVWDRESKKFFYEKVYGGGAINALYSSGLAKFLVPSIGSIFSEVYGSYKATRLSAKAIPEFIKNFQIPKEEFVSEEYQSFNDFFIRRFREGARDFGTNPHSLRAFAEGRYLAFAEIEQKIPVKGVNLELTVLLKDLPERDLFKSGPTLIARLCPVDYHRFHFPCAGKILKTTRSHGPLHSVNPIAMENVDGILFTNERQVSLLETPVFGLLAYIEVGALCVGRIVQTHGEKFKTGDEKGYFLFGGSTVILVGQKGKFRIDEDLLEKSAHGQEVFVKLGTQIGEKL